MVCKHLGRIRSENAGGESEGVKEERGEEKREEMVAIGRVRGEGVQENDSGEGMLKVLDKNHCYKLTLTKGGPDPDLFSTFFNRASEIIAKQSLNYW